MVTARHRAGPFSDWKQERESADLGMWVFLSTEILFFGVLFFGYLIMRLRFPTAFGAASRHTDLVLGTLNTAVLLTSSLTMALGVRAAALKWRRGAAGLLGATAAFGVAFLIIKAFEYHAEYLHHLVPGGGFHFDAPSRHGAELFFWLYFVMTGFHGLHVAIGILLLGFVAARVARRGFTIQSPLSIEVTGLYWHFVDIVWIFLFPSLYLVART